MINDFCPKCNALTIMTSITAENIEKDNEDNIYKVITISYHCSKCHCFVKSEDEKICL